MTEVELNRKFKSLIDGYIEKAMKIPLRQMEMANRNINIIQELLDHLPDSNHPDNESWQWCWDELNESAQDAIKNVRDKASGILNDIRQMGETE